MIWIQVIGCVSAGLTMLLGMIGPSLRESSPFTFVLKAFGLFLGLSMTLVSSFMIGKLS